MQEDLKGLSRRRMRGDLMEVLRIFKEFVEFVKKYYFTVNQSNVTRR